MADGDVNMTPALCLCLTDCQEPTHGTVLLFIIVTAFCLMMWSMVICFCLYFSRRLDEMGREATQVKDYPQVSRDGHPNVLDVSSEENGAGIGSAESNIANHSRSAMDYFDGRHRPRILDRSR